MNKEQARGKNGSDGTKSTTIITWLFFYFLKDGEMCGPKWCGGGVIAGSLENMKKETEKIRAV